MKFFYNTRKINFLFIIFILFFSFFTSNVLASETSGTITPSSGYAWGPILGWINFACTNCNVNITDTALTGYAWSDQYGWINLSPANGGVTNNCLGQLGGTAWSSHLGWINFSGASIDSNGKFEDLAGSPTDKSGNINFACTNCNVETDWKQCSLRAAPTPQVLINSVAATTTPNVSANVTITNEGAIPYEYSYEWCVVSNASDVCNAGDGNIYYSSASKSITPGLANSFITTLSATVPNPGTYYFKLTASYGASQSSASQQFTIGSTVVPPVSNGGGGGGGGGYASIPTNIGSLRLSAQNQSVVVGNNVKFNVYQTGFTNPVYSLTDSFVGTSVVESDLDLSGAFSWTPIQSDVGVHYITITAADLYSHKLNTVSTITVNVMPGYTFVSNIISGETGNDVLELQKALVQLGFLTVTPTGHYGPATMAAVGAFQKANNITQTESVGPLTRAALNKAIGASATSTASQTKQQLIQSIQQKIAQLQIQIAQLLAAGQK